MDDKLLAKITAWRDDPVLFVREAFGVVDTPEHPALEEWQEKALRAIVTNDRVAIRSGHGVGKSTFLSWVILWWLLTRLPATIGCTAPTAKQLENVLWKECKLWHRKLPPAFQKLLTITSDSIFLTEAPESCFAVATTARKENPEALQGLHAKHMLFVIDECSGVDDVVFEPVLGTMTTPGAKTVMTGNPTRISGYFFNAFHSMANRWWTLRVSCEESTRVSPAFKDEIIQLWGEDSNVFRIRYLGEFPTAEEDAVIPLSLVKAAVARDIEPSVEDVLWGVDVARKGGDRCALAKRTNTRLLEPVKWWRDKTIPQTVGIIKHEWDTCHSWERPRLILVDAIGFGAGVGDDLRELGLPIKLVNVAELPGEVDLYLRLRDELWFKARDWFEARACWIPDDRELIAELTMVRFEYRSSGKMSVESKDEMKKRTSPRKSPDLADAFVITFDSRGHSAMTRIEQPAQTETEYEALMW